MIRLYLVFFGLKGAVCDSVSVSWKVVEIWAQHSVELHLKPALMGWDCLWLGPSYCVCFLFTEPGLLRNTHVTERPARGPWGAICWIWQKVYGIRSTDSKTTHKIRKLILQFCQGSFCLQLYFFQAWLHHTFVSRPQYPMQKSSLIDVAADICFFLIPERMWWGS